VIVGKLSRAEAKTKREFNTMNTLLPVLLSYIAGLKAHDVDAIATTVAEDLRFITPASARDKGQFLSFLRALHSAFPDWYYDQDEPELRDDEIAVKWRHWHPCFTRHGCSSSDRQEGDDPGTVLLLPCAWRPIVEIRPDPIAGGAPQGTFEQIDMKMIHYSAPMTFLA
jgi:hypothetical protein